MSKLFAVLTDRSRSEQAFVCGVLATLMVINAVIQVRALWDDATYSWPTAPKGGESSAVPGRVA